MKTKKLTLFLTAIAAIASLLSLRLNYLEKIPDIQIEPNLWHNVQSKNSVLHIKIHNDGKTKIRIKKIEFSYLNKQGNRKSLQHSSDYLIDATPLEPHSSIEINSDNMDTSVAHQAMKTGLIIITDRNDNSYERKLTKSFLNPFK